MPEPSGLPLRRRLLVLVAVALVPVAVLALIGMLLLAKHRGGELERATIETMRAMASAVDSELNRQIAGLETLADSRHLDTGDLTAFYQDALRISEGRPLWNTVILTDSNGRELLDVTQVLGSSLPEVTPLDSIRRLLDTQRPAVGNMVSSSAPVQPSFSVAVPVVREGRLKYALGVELSPETMRRVIERQRVPEDGVVSILDASGRHVARSRLHDRFVGRPPAVGLVQLMSLGAEGWGPSVTLEGQPIYAAFSRSSSTGWSVAVGVPAEDVDAAMWRSSVMLVVGVLSSALLGVLASALVARRITRPIAALRTAAQALGRGDVPDAPVSSLPEVREVAEALAGAGRDRRRAEAEREELLRRERLARESAEEANRMKDEFLAMLGHELRNPLAAISGAVSLLEGRSRDAVAVKAERVAKRQVEHLTRMMDDLLDVSRLMTGKIVLEQAVVDLGQIVREATSTLQAAGKLGEHGVTTRLDSIWIDADATRIEQIVTNLLLNAAKYTPAGGSIDISLGLEQGQAVLRVKDTGLGMSAELVPRVFELFVQGERPLDRTQGGLGIGLTLVRRLVELHGGSISAASDGPGRGSLFTVWLPVVEAPRAPAPEVPRQQAVARDVMLVEDNEDTREMLKEALEQAGHDVRTAVDGPSAVAGAVERAPQVAIIDIGLPGLDGYQVARQIRSHYKERTPTLIALTGYGSPEDRRRAREAGFDHHLVKPVNLEELARLLEAPLRSEQPAP